jgi:hypothetical protein
MGHDNFKDEVLIKRWWAYQKINGMGGKPIDENKWNNH